MSMKQKKDILFLCQYFYPEYVSSATLPYDTAEALVKAGFSVGAICGYPKEYNNSREVPKKEVHEGIEIKRLKYLQLKRSNFIGRLINYFSFTFSVSLRFRQLKDYKTIIVYSNPPVLPFVAAMASKFFGTKMIFVSYDVYPEIAVATNIINQDSIINKMMIIINKSVFKYANRVVALSNEMKEYLLEHRPLLKKQRVDVIPNWYEDKELKDTSQSYENKRFEDIKPKNNFIISYFGNMGTAQDIDTIISAITNFKDEDDIRFVFAGHGNKMNRLKDIVQAEVLKNIEIFDFLHGQDFQDALNISDCFLVSLADGVTGLAVPSKTYSYMMSSKPVIAIMDKTSDISKDLMDNEAGYAVEVGQVSELINAINELKVDKGKCDLMGTRCRRIFLEKYTKEHCTQQYVDMMKNILEE